MSAPTLGYRLQKQKERQIKPIISVIPDWGSRGIIPKSTGQSVKNQKKIGKVEIQPLLKVMGTGSPTGGISLPCKSINDMSNKRINGGVIHAFNNQPLNAQPMTGMSPLFFQPSQRIGKFGMAPGRAPVFASFSSC
tara:strand:+ start:177 stop:584 length:408 start_codon:yes stop_codon:yes gene_type:complete